MESVSSIECVRDPGRAAMVLDPLRLAILERSREPRSASDIAGELGLPRQRVNYHVKELAKAGFLAEAGRVRRRNFYEQRYRATAGGYLVSPEALGPMAADPEAVEDRMSAAYLLALSARLQREVGGAAERARAEGWRLATLSMDAELRFESAGQRRAFTEALRDAVAAVIAEHAAPARTDDGSPGAGTPYRLMLGCWPVPAPQGGPKDPEARNPERGDAA